MTKYPTSTRKRRHSRIRAKIFGTQDKPRLAVYRSNNYIQAQLIDDQQSHTLGFITSKSVEGRNFSERAFNTGKKIAEVAAKAGIKKVSFDRGGFTYTGRVKALADGARDGGLEF